MPLTVLLSLAVASYAAFGLLAAKAAGKIDAALSAVVFNGVGALLPLAVFLWARSARGTAVLTTGSGWGWSILAGVAVGTFSTLLLAIFERGDVSFAIPIVYGGTIILVSLGGALLFSESVSVLQALGLCLTAIGVFTVALSKS